MQVGTSVTAIRMIAGLGNPGSKYSETRHNAGFWFLDALAREKSFDFKPEKRFHGEMARVTLHGHDLRLLKPGSYMNRSGEALQAAASYFNIKPEEILVAYDDLDLPAGEVKLKSGGGHGGHNGLRDIHQKLGSNAYQRLRLGIGHPGHKDQVVSWVLNKPGRDDAVAIEHGIVRAIEILPSVLDGDMASAMNRLHGENKRG